MSRSLVRLTFVIFAALGVFACPRDKELTSKASALRGAESTVEAPADTSPQAPAVPSTVVSPPPAQTAAKWPAHCLIEDMAPHPTQPWLAVACTHGEEEKGAVMIFDTQAGSLRSVAIHDGFVGWSDSGHLRWHPDGRRLATNIDTNGIALLDGNTWVGAAYPDEGRDHGVKYVWVDERMFTDTGHFFEIRPGDYRFDLPRLDGPSFRSALTWNAAIGAVVGGVGPSGIAAYDPRRQALLYENELDSPPDPAFHPGRQLSCSSSGRWCAFKLLGVHPGPDALLFVDGGTGKLHGLRHASSPKISKTAWGGGEALAVSSHLYRIGEPNSDYRVDIFVSGELRNSFALGARRIQVSLSVAGARPMAWSPDSRGLALLLDGQEVAVYDAQSTRVVSRFKAPAPAIPPELPSYYVNGSRPDYGFPGDLLWLEGQRLVRIAPHFVSIWTLDGQKVAEFIVPVSQGP